MTTVSDPVFLDTNVLIYAADQSAAFHAACKALLERGIRGDVQLVLSPQILAEFIAIATNPNVMPTPLPATEAYAHTKALSQSFRVVVPSSQVFDRVLELLAATRISGKRVHDVLHAATMLDNDVAAIYTYDTGFQSIPGITVLTPESP
jgi:toxin-antitoxin system PIN domain toxin